MPGPEPGAGAKPSSSKKYGKKVNETLARLDIATIAPVIKAMLPDLVAHIAIPLALFPLDTIKTRLQTTNSKQLLASGKLFHSLYDGLVPEVARAAILFALDGSRLTSYEMIRWGISVPFEVTEAAMQIRHEMSSSQTLTQLASFGP
jgi:hypothetical protein